MDDPSPEVVSAFSYKDRSAGLVIFGIFTVLMGCLAALLVPLMLFAETQAAKAPGGVPPGGMAFPAAMYGVAAMVLIWLGIGSAMKRRWARALLLILSWGWLITGVIGIAGAAITMPAAMAHLPAPPIGSQGSQPQVTPAMMAGVMTFTFIFMGVLFIVLPAIWIFFYGSKHVKATVEARDPVERWTDRCPLPVLAVVLWLALSAPMMAAMPFIYKPVIGFFGIFLTGIPALAAYFVIAVLWGYAAWSLYHLRRQGWWLVVVVMLAFSISWYITISRNDPLEMYRLMGFQDAQIDQLKTITPFILGRHYWEIMFAALLPFFGYMLFIKKFFPRQQQTMA